MATTHTSPVSAASLITDVGLAYVYAEQMILQELTEATDLMGLMPLAGDIMGTGTNTLRIPRYSGLGYDEAFQAMTSETDPIVATGFATDYDTATYARHGLAKSKTYQSEIESREQLFTLDGLISFIPQSVIKTMRELMLAAGTGITGVVGTSGTAWTYDDELNLKTSFNETTGFKGIANTVRHSEQYTDLLKSLRNEPAYQQSDVQNTLQSLRASGEAFDFLGLNNYSSNDVNTSGGDHIGFAWAPGALVRVIASTTPVPVADPATSMFVPQWGLVVERKSTGRTAQARYDANLFAGVTLMSSAVFPQLRIRSIND